MRRFLWCAVFMAAPCPLASAAITNGDFASGNFTGWSTLVSTPALGASAVVSAFPDGHRAVLTSTPTSTSPATSAIQQGFSAGPAQRLTFSYSFDQTLAGLAAGQAGISNASIVVSLLGSNWSESWTTTLYNDPVHSASSSTVPYGSVSLDLPQGGLYVFYAQVQAQDGPGGNDAYAQLMLGDVQLVSAVLPEPASGVSLLCGLGVAVPYWAWRRRKAA